MLTTVHPPFDTRVFYREAQSLVNHGHEVTIIAPHTEIINEIIDGVHIKTIQKPNSKALHFLTMFKIFKEGFKIKCDVFHCHEPGSLLICFILKVLTGNKMVYDAHEYYPELIAENVFFPKVIKKPIHAIVNKGELFLCKFCDYIITVNESLRKRFAQFGNTVVLYNVPSLDLFPLQNVEMEQNTIVYAGYVSRERGLDKLLKSLLDVRKAYPNLFLLVAGYIQDTDEFKIEVKNFIDDNSLNGNVKITGWLPYADIVTNIQKSMAGMILFQPIYYNNIIGLPNKLFEYMACGKPVIASDFPEIRAIVKEANCGLLIDSSNIDDITKAIIWIMNNPKEAQEMGSRGRKSVEKKYNWAEMEKLLFNMYDDISIVQ